MDSLLSGNTIASSAGAEVNAPATRSKTDGLDCTPTPTFPAGSPAALLPGLLRNWDVNRPVWRQKLLRTDGTVVGWFVAFNIAEPWDVGMDRGEPKFVIKFFDGGDKHDLKEGGHDLAGTQFGEWLTLALETLKPEVSRDWLRWAHEVAIEAATDDLQLTGVRVNGLSKADTCKAWQILHGLRVAPARAASNHFSRDSYEAGW